MVATSTTALDFPAALDRLIDGYSISRAPWMDGMALRLWGSEEGRPYIALRLPVNYRALIPYCVTQDDLTARDWRVVSDRQPFPFSKEPQTPQDGETFSGALLAVLDGARAWRTGWNHADQYIYRWGMMPDGGGTPYIAFRNHLGRRYPWTVNHSDLLAGDWAVSEAADDAIKTGA